jgi:hypothetical protein
MRFRALTSSGVVPSFLLVAACVAALLVSTPCSAGERRRDRDVHEKARPHRPMRHRYPVYIPPPIYYPHYETPGITIVIPLDLR